MCESCAVIYFTDSPTRNNFGNCRFQPDGPGARCVSAAAAAGQQPGEDLDSGREVQRNLDHHGRHLPDIAACQGQRRGSGNITSGRITARERECERERGKERKKGRKVSERERANN